MQRPLQVVIDPDNHTKMKFVSIHPKKKKKKNLLLANKPSGKRKRKTKHLGPASPSLKTNVVNTRDVYDFEDSNDSKMETNTVGKTSLNLVHIKVSIVKRGSVSNEWVKSIVFFSYCVPNTKEQKKI